MQEHVTGQQTLLSQALKRRAAEEGFNPVGIARIPGSPRLQLRTKALQRWLDHGHQADMAWMAAPRRQDAKLLLDGANSVLAVGLNYYVDAQPSPGSLKVARYGWGRDYHRVVDQRLRRIGRWLSEQRPDCGWRACVDSTPLLDKAWAEEAGLGWIGKNQGIGCQRQLNGEAINIVPINGDHDVEILTRSQNRIVGKTDHRGSLTTTNLRPR